MYCYVSFRVYGMKSIDEYKIPTFINIAARCAKVPLDETADDDRIFHRIVDRVMEQGNVEEYVYGKQDQARDILDLIYPAIMQITRDMRLELRGSGMMDRADEELEEFSAQIKSAIEYLRDNTNTKAGLEEMHRLRTQDPETILNEIADGLTRILNEGEEVAVIAVTKSLRGFEQGDRIFRIVTGTQDGPVMKDSKFLDSDQ